MWSAAGGALLLDPSRSPDPQPRDVSTDGGPPKAGQPQSRRRNGCELGLDPLMWLWAGVTGDGSTPELIMVSGSAPGSRLARLMVRPATSVQ